MSKISTNAPDTFINFGKKSARELGTYILYVDLNSCFASTEQQSRPKLREKPVVVTNRLVKNSMIIAASTEAKALGIKVGMRIEEAKAIYSKVIAAETEPEKYIYVHKLLKKILSNYSSRVIMKSIDEGMIDLKDATAEVQNLTIEELAQKIKTQVFEEIGCAMRCNIGFGRNRFYAKLAAELHKPNGADVIIKENVCEIFPHLKLTDLPGINKRFEERLNVVKIYKPMEFLDAKCATLEKMVFKSIVGKQWYDRLREKEVDDIESETKTIGRQFVLPPGTDNEMVKIYLAHLCEDAGARLRSQKLFARGIQIARVNGHGFSEKNDQNSKKITKLFEIPFNSDAEIIHHALELFNELKSSGRIITVTLYKLQSGPSAQLSVFEEDLKKKQKIAEITDNINSRFGSRTIHSALTTNTDEVKCKIPFGSTKFFDI